MPTGYLTRIVEFTATHRFPDLPEFAGATGDHSHRYRCLVTVKGVFDPTRAGVMSLKALDTLLQREVVERFNGRHINRDVAAFAAALPPGVTLHCVRVEEGAHLYSEYFGES